MAHIGHAFAKQREFGLTIKPSLSLTQTLLPGALLGSQHDGTEVANLNPRFQQVLRKRLRQARYRIHRRHSMEVSLYESPLKVIASPMSPQNRGAAPNKKPHRRGDTSLKNLFFAFKAAASVKRGMDGGPNKVTLQAAMGMIEEEEEETDLEKLMEGEVHHHRRKFFCYSDTPAKMYWDMFLASLVIYTCLSVPYRIGFAVEAGKVGNTFEKLINFVFMADILVTFRTPYPDERGVLVSDPWRIAYRYLRGDLFIDLISSIPFDSILEGTGNSSRLGRSVMLLRALRLTRLLRLFRVAKMRRILEDRQSTMVLSNNTNRSIRVGITLLVMAHLLGSAWHGMSLVVSDPKHTWLAALIAANNGSKTISLARRYVSSLYYAFTTMTTVGYGDIITVSDQERLYSIVVMLFGGMVFGLVVGNVTAIIQNLNPVETHYRERLTEIKAYMRNRKIPRILFQRIKLYFEYHYQDTSVLEDPHVVLGKLTGPVAMQLQFVHHDRMIRRIPFLHLQQPSFSVAIARILKPMLLFRGEMLYYQDDLGTSFYFVVKGGLETHVMVEEEDLRQDALLGGEEGGAVRESKPPPPRILHFGVVPEESFTGEIPLMLNCLHPLSAVAPDDAEIYWCSRHELMIILSTALDVQHELFTTAVRNHRKINHFILQMRHKRKSKREEKEAEKGEDHAGDGTITESVASVIRSVQKGRQNMEANAALLGTTVQNGSEGTGRGKLMCEVTEGGPNEKRPPGDQGLTRKSSVHSLLLSRPAVLEFDDSVYDARLAADPAYLLEKKRLIHPDTSWKVSWDVLVYSLSIYSVLSVTLRAGFDLPFDMWFFVFDIFVNTIFFLDIVATFFTAEWSRLEKTFITNKTVLALNYLRGWFWVDVASTLPFELIGDFSHGQHKFPHGTLVKILRMLRLVRISRFGKLIKKMEAYEEDTHILNPNLVKLAKIVVILVFVAHVDACLWYFTGSLSTKSWITNYCPDGCLHQKSLSSRYLASLYWSITTMMTVGYGDITPYLNKQKEMVVAIMTQIIGAVTISYLIGTMLNLIVNFNPAERRRANQNSLLNEYLRYLLLKSKGNQRLKVLRSVASHYMHALDSRSVFPQDDILSRLPPCLQYALVLVLYHKVLPRLPLFCAVEERFPKALSLLLPILQPARYQAGDVIYTESLFGRELTFVTTGTCELRKKGRRVASVYCGQFFGEGLLLLREDIPCQLLCQVVAVTDCEVLVLTRPYYTSLWDFYPHMMQYFDFLLTSPAEALDWIYVAPASLEGGRPHSPHLTGVTSDPAALGSHAPARSSGCYRMEQFERLQQTQKRRSRSADEREETDTTSKAAAEPVGGSLSDEGSRGPSPSAVTPSSTTETMSPKETGSPPSVMTMINRADSLLKLEEYEDEDMTTQTPGMHKKNSSRKRKLGAS